MIIGGCGRDTGRRQRRLEASLARGVGGVGDYDGIKAMDRKTGVYSGTASCAYAGPPAPPLSKHPLSVPEKLESTRCDS